MPGPPGSFRVRNGSAARRTYVDPKSGAVHQTLEVALTALQLSPLDALYLAEGNEQAQRSELEQRLALHLLRSRPASVPAGADLRLRFGRDPGWTEDVVSFGEFIEIARTARKLFAGARALDGRDLLLPGAAAASGLDTDELAQRTEAAAQALAAAQQALQSLLPIEQAERDGAPVDLEALRQALLRLAHFGIQGAVPLMAVGDSSEARSALLTQGRSVAKEVDDRRKRLSGLTAAFDAAHASPEARRDYELARLTEIFGPDFRVMPQLQPANSSDLNETFAASLYAAGQRSAGGSHLVSARRLRARRRGAARCRDDLRGDLGRRRPADAAGRPASAQSAGSVGGPSRGAPVRHFRADGCRSLLTRRCRRKPSSIGPWLVS